MNLDDLSSNILDRDNLEVGGDGQPLTLYISGPMTGKEDHNFPAFKKAKEAILNLEIDCISPTDISPETQYFGPKRPDDASYRDYITRDLLYMLDRCNGICLLEGWTESEGVRIELGVALGLKWPVYYYSEETGLRDIS